MDRTDEDRAEVLPVQRLIAFAADFASLPWANIFQANAEFQALIRSLLSEAYR